jgi:hypothetical protein
VNFPSELPWLQSAPWLMFFSGLGNFRHVHFQLVAEVVSGQQRNQMRPSHLGKSLAERAIDDVIIFHNRRLVRGLHPLSAARVTWIHYTLSRICRP